MVQATEKQIEFIKKMVAKRANWHTNMPKPLHSDKFEDARFQAEVDREKQAARFFEEAVIDYASLTSAAASKLIDALTTPGNAAFYALEEIYERELEHFFGQWSVAYVENGMVEDTVETVEFTAEQCQSEIEAWQTKLSTYTNNPPRLLKFAPETLKAKIEESHKAITEWQRRLDFAQRNGKFVYHVSRGEAMLMQMNGE